MMSPLTVSQFLPPDMPLRRRSSSTRRRRSARTTPINCIYRGRQLIVAGDQKQLPPTDFFDAGRTTDDDEDDEERPGLLRVAPRPVQGQRRAPPASRCAGTTAAGTRI